MIEHETESERRRYNEEYFKTRCGAYDDYQQGRISLRYDKLLKYLSLPVNTALDLGCGRGEATVLLSRSLCSCVVGIDFSDSALRLTKRTIAGHCSHKEEERISLIEADAACIPLKDNSCDIIVALDILEHLRQNDLENMLKECSRVLRLGGGLLVHTSPNVIVARVVRFFARVIFGLKERPLHEKVHITEQTAWSLARNMRRTGLHFTIKYRIQPDFFLEKLKLAHGYDRKRFVFILAEGLCRIFDALWVIFFTPLLYVPICRSLIANNFLVVAEKKRDQLYQEDF